MTELRRNDARVEQKIIQLNCSNPCPSLGIALFVFQPSRSRNAAPIVQLYFHSLGLQAQARKLLVHQNVQAWHFGNVVAKRTWMVVPTVTSVVQHKLH